MTGFLLVRSARVCYSELVERTASELSVHFTEHLERITSEHPALAPLAATVEMHSRTLTELVALPGLLEQLQQALYTQVRTVVQQEMQTAVAAHAEHHRTPRARNFRWWKRIPNTEQRTTHRKRTVPKVIKGRLCGAVSLIPRACVTPTFSTRRVSRASPFRLLTLAKSGKRSSESKPPS
jgi:hypothetical protein